MLMEFISNLSSFATIHSWLKEQYERRIEVKKTNQVNGIDLEVREKILKNFTEEEEIEYIDNFIAKHSYQIKDNGLSILFSEEEIQESVCEICRSNPIYDKQKVTVILDEYFRLLSKYLNENLSFETKFLRKCIKEEGDRIIDAISDIIPEKNIFNDIRYSSVIIGKCNMLNSLLIKSKFNKMLLRKSFTEDYLMADNLEDVFLKLNNVFNNFDISFLNKEAHIKSTESIEVMYNFVLTQAFGTAIDLVEFYSLTIRHIIDCISSYTYKDKTFYMSLGALGLVDDNSDRAIYECVMNNIATFLDKVSRVLVQCWKDIDYKKNEDTTINQMNKELLHKMKWYFNRDTKEALKLIYNNKKILDIDLARRCGIEISSLRKILYDCTKEFLGYTYADNHSTYLYIKADYRIVVEEYYEELFEEE